MVALPLRTLARAAIDLRGAKQEAEIVRPGQPTPARWGKAKGWQPDAIPDDP
jgi:hypothetical protein